MENGKPGTLHWLSRAFKAIAYTVIVLFVLFVGTCAYQANQQSGLGRQWCESTIRDYEADQNRFRESHAKEARGGRLNLRPGPEHKGARAEFTVSETGAYACRYSHGGAFGAHGYEYSSRKKEWTYVD